MDEAAQPENGAHQEAQVLGCVGRIPYRTASAISILPFILSSAAAFPSPRGVQIRPTSLRLSS
jgi:hypothetical protein